MKFRYIGSGKDSPRKIMFMGTEEFTLEEVSDVVDPFCIEKLKTNKCFILVQEVETFDIPEEADDEGEVEMAESEIDAEILEASEATDEEVESEDSDEVMTEPESTAPVEVHYAKPRGRPRGATSRT